MRISATIFFSLTFFLAIEQDIGLLGKYTHSLFMYEYFQTLSDSGKFNIEEHSDLGTRITVGTWTREDNIIKLTPTRAFHSNHSKEIYSIPLEKLEESIISIDKENRLTILAPKKNEGTKMEIPNYRLSKIENEQLKIN